MKKNNPSNTNHTNPSHDRVGGASLTVDCVIFGYDDEALNILLIQRGIEPFINEWALPGGFVLAHETLDEAARRELKEEAGIENMYMEQLYTFGNLDRDPRGRVVSVAYFALVKLADYQDVSADTDAKDARWFPIALLPKLAFDHAEILEIALHRLQAKVLYEPIVFELLPEKFVFGQLEKVYEAILQRKIDRRNFRKKILATGYVIELDEVKMDVAHRPPKLFKSPTPTLPQGEGGRNQNATFSLSI
ncbi:MAG: hypothetical protein RLZZ292_1018 [Bacteroidota bacterium]|jgi:8-oxo-dGTP diphosphatase